MIKAGIIGITGKMGKALIEASHSSKTFEVSGISRSNHLKQSHIPLSTLEKTPLNTLDILIDVSSFEALEENLMAAVASNLPIIIGTTNHKEKEFNLMNLASKTIPVLYSSNFSIGIHLLKTFIKEHASFLENCFIDIFETHHLDKKDAPSGTALDLARLFNKKNTTLQSPNKRSEEDLVIHSTRLPSHPGEHTVQLTLKDEILSLHHQVTDRKVYAHGALLAAQFLIKQKKGFYNFSDVFAT